MSLEPLKALAAQRAADEVRSGMLLGLGTGSTVAHLLDELGRRLADGRLTDIRGVPTSERTAEHARRVGIPLIQLEEALRLDLCIDGADEVDPQLDLVKGLGAALLREKMVACAAMRFVVIADATKRVERLLSRAPLPIEVVPFAAPVHEPFLRSLGLTPKLRRGQDGQPIRTDNGNFVIDGHAARPGLDPAEIARALDLRPGIVDHGFFLQQCTRAYIALESGVIVLDRP